MPTFGEGFGRDEFARAAASEAPSELNSVKAIERGVDQLFNYVVVSARGFGAAQNEAAQPSGVAATARTANEWIFPAGVTGEAPGNRLQ
jgi:hypothetical protein